MNFDWQVVALTTLADRVRAAAPSGRPGVVAVNGHSSSGKTTLSGQLTEALPSAAVLHTDDLAWHHGVFSWDELLLESVLPQVHAGRPLHYRPPAWIERGREGAIELPGDLAWLVLEGVGASQPSVRSSLDVVVWVETDEPTRAERDRVRLTAGEMSRGGYERWMAEENAYVVAHEPWLDADLITYGGDSIAHDRHTEVVLSAAPRPLP